MAANKNPRGNAALAGAAQGAQQQPAGPNPATISHAPGDTIIARPSLTPGNPGPGQAAGAGPDDGAAVVVNNTPSTFPATYPGLTPGSPGVHGNAGAK